MACWDYDRTAALLDGSIRPDGIDLVGLPLPVEETFFRMLHFEEFDVAEMSLSAYVLSLFSDSPPFVAVPAFPSRMFRHSCIYVNEASGIDIPHDLVGKTVGIPEYHITSAVWIRGILADEYDVPLDSVTYKTGGQEQPGRTERITLSLPPNIRVEPIGPTETLSAMLEAGEIDAAYTARAPSPFQTGSPRVRRLFPEYASVEQEYFQRTGIFPIMHTVVIKRALYERSPWVAQSLFKAFSLAKDRAYQALRETTALKYTLPWLRSHVEDTEATMGRDFWPYGLEPNREVLATFLRYSYEQGLAKRLLRPEELFVPETLASYRV